MVTCASALLVFVLATVCTETECLLDRCNKSISDQFLANQQLLPTILGEFYGKRFWGAASNEYDNMILTPFAIEYGKEVNHGCNVTVYFYDPIGTTAVTTSQRVVVDYINDNYLGYSLSSTFNALYASKCSEHLFMIYRCQVAWESGGPTYQVFVDNDIREEDISQEIEECIKAIKAIDETAVLVRQKRPTDS